jgi:chitinase
MSRFLSILVSAILATSSLCAFAGQSRPAPIVLAYVFPQANVLQPGQIDALSLTRINYAFANIADGRMVTGFANDAANFAYLTGLRKTNPSLKIFVSVGGWLWSTNFSDVCLTESSRQRFIESVIVFLTLYELDGLDIDWEYPGLPGAGHPFRNEDKQNFTTLLKELHKRFDQDAKKTGRPLLLTIAAGASDEYIAHTEMEKVQKYVDTVNLMGYDYYEPDSDAITGNHAPLFTDPADPKKISVDASVRAFEQAGVPAEKILLGAPFYGHVWGNVAAQNNGLFQPGKKIPSAYAPFSAIESTMLNNGFVRYWDSMASVPYLYNPDKQIFVSYEDPQSLAAKGAYVLNHKLGGIMFWDYSGDPSGKLLSAINLSLRSSSVK